MKSFVEYGLQPDDAGYCFGAMAETWHGVHLQFLPKPEYNGRRVEIFVSEEEASRFIKSHSHPGLFKLATDLADADYKRLLTEAAETLVAQGLAEVKQMMELLMTEVGKLRAEVTTLRGERGVGKTEKKG